MRDEGRRKTLGAYYTPQPVARYIVQHVFERLAVDGSTAACLPRVLDPACGDGVFLREAWAQLAPRQSGDAGGRMSLAGHLFGIDVDAPAVEAARQWLAGQLGKGETSSADRDRMAALCRQQIRCGDALLDAAGGPAARSRPAKTGTGERVPGDWPSQGFDAIVGNPPYVNIRLLARTHGAGVNQHLRKRYRCAYRAYDLYALFLERAYELLRPGGVCGMIIPNKFATLDYALPLRRLLKQRTRLWQVTDVAAARIFPDAGVYPYIVVWEKKRPGSAHCINFSVARSIPQLASPAVRSVPQSELSPEYGFDFHGALGLDARDGVQSLSRVATLHSGTTGFSAAAVARELIDRGTKAGAEAPSIAIPEKPAVRAATFPFIVSGNIDRYVIRQGNVRFMKHVYADPVLPQDAESLSAAKRALFADSKIVIAGMGRRLEAAYDPGGLALGVQVYAAAALKVDPMLLLGILNSRLISYWFRLRFQAKRLAGDYLSINKRQLAQIPVCAAASGDRARLGRQIARLVQSRVRLPLPPLGERAEPTELDARIDGLVSDLYQLSDIERERVAAAFNATDVVLPAA